MKNLLCNKMWLIRFIILLAIMWYMVARDICSLFVKYEIMNDEVCRNLAVRGLNERACYYNKHKTNI